MSEQFKEKKICVMGIQGSGKTFFAKELVKREFKKCYWYLINFDDAKDMPKNVDIILPKTKKAEELDLTCKSIIRLGKAKEIDCFVIDEADLFIRENRHIPEALNDLIINHRHFNLSVVFITRRPQDLPTKIVESCEHNFIFALANSDNINRKMKAIDNDLPELMKKLNVDNHMFVHKRLGFEPELMNAIKLKGGN